MLGKQSRLNYSDMEANVDFPRTQGLGIGSGSRVEESANIQ